MLTVKSAISQAKPLWIWIIYLNLSGFTVK